MDEFLHVARSIPPAESVEGPPTDNGSRRPRVLFLDPIGHALAAHDRAIGDGLTAAGLDVTVGTSLTDAPPAAYRQVFPYGGVVGDHSRAVKLLSFLRARRRILREARSWDAQVVVLYYVLEPVLDRLLVRRLRRRGIPTIVCVHDVLPLRASRGARVAHGRLYRDAPHVLTFGEATRSQLVREFGVPPDRLSVSRFGVDIGPEPSADSRRQARRALGLPADEDVVLCLGQIKRNKDVDVLVEAYARCPRARDRARLYIVGRPWRVDLAPFRDQVAAAGLEDRVEFRAEWVAEEDLPRWMQAANVMVLPYRELYQSDVVLQACSVGAPVVATAVGNLPEVIRTDDTGWLVPPGDAEAMSQAIGAALADPAEAARRGCRGRERVGREWRWSRFTRDLSDLVRTIAREAAAP